MLEIRNLSAGYGGTPILQDISLAFPAGKVTVLAGPNGCGKSTLLKAIAGILPASGECLLEGGQDPSYGFQQRGSCPPPENVCWKALL